jgi:hypothetical protein
VSRVPVVPDVVMAGLLREGDCGALVSGTTPIYRRGASSSPAASATGSTTSPGRSSSKLQRGGSVEALLHV